MDKSNTILKYIIIHCGPCLELTGNPECILAFCIKVQHRRVRKSTYERFYATPSVPMKFALYTAMCVFTVPYMFIFPSHPESG